jgi:hypothetical protein
LDWRCGLSGKLPSKHNILSLNSSTVKKKKVLVCGAEKSGLVRWLLARWVQVFFSLFIS